MGRPGESVTTAHVSSATYSYSAVLPDGSRTSGKLLAESRDQALMSLQDRGWYPVEVRATGGLAPGKRTLPLDDLALGLRVLATLLDAGLSMNKTLAAFGDLAPESREPAILPVSDAVRNGKTLADALSASPLNVPPVVIGILHAGEAGSGLAPAALRAAEIIERSAATRAAVRGALAYPALLAVTGSAPPLCCDLDRIESDASAYDSVRARGCDNHANSGNSGSALCRRFTRRVDVLDQDSTRSCRMARVSFCSAAHRGHAQERGDFTCRCGTCLATRERRSTRECAAVRGSRIR
jgi:hypothetical protein